MAFRSLKEPREITHTFLVFAMPIFYYGAIDYWVNDHSRFVAVPWYPVRAWVVFSVLITLLCIVTAIWPTERRLRITLSCCGTWFLLRLLSNLIAYANDVTQIIHSIAQWGSWLLMVVVVTQFSSTTRQLYIALVNENRVLRAATANKTIAPQQIENE